MSAKTVFTKLFACVMLLSLLFPSQAFAVVTGSTSSGWNVYDPTSESGTANYRYGPSMILNADDSIDMWTCSPGTGSTAWDYIRYKRSPDNGVTWGAESVVLAPTPGSSDSLSTCDPGVVKFGGYYYMGYTSTLNTYGTDNDIYVARSASPGGPYEKWNGSGWGGNPQPFIVFDDAPVDTYGAGEPSLVVKDSTLYIYYTWMTRDSSTGKPVNQTRVRTASTANANWPGATTYQGVAIQRDVDGDDSTDHKYVPSMNKFIAMGTAKRFGPFAYVKLYESADGLSYKPATLPKNFINTFAHNGGITGDEKGHFDTAKNNRIAYAYGTQWGYWYTAMNPISLTDSNLPAVPIVKAVLQGNGQVQLHFRTTGIAGETYKIKYGTASGTYTTTVPGVTSSPYTITGLTNGTPYYFAVASSSASGDSANSAQVSATPLNLSVSPRSAVTSSSQLSGWEASKAIDADPSTTWSSTGHSNNMSAEWITVDTGSNRMVKRVTLTARQPSEFGYPNKFKIQVSTDNANWVDAAYDNGQYRLESPARNVYDFNEPLYGRYVRILASQLNPDQNQPYVYYMQLGDIRIEDIPYGASASSSLSGWTPDKVLDRVQPTSWSGNSYSTAAHTEWISLNMGAAQPVSGVRVTPRLNGLGFPVDFKFQSSSNGTTWADISGASYTAYPNPGSSVRVFPFGSTVHAQYIRMIATKLGPDDFGIYYMQLSDMSVNTFARRTPSASSALSGWETEKAADSAPDTYWSTTAHSSAGSTEWLTVDMGGVQNWSGVRLIPRPNYGFPVDFSLQSSNDGTTWTTIPGQSYISYYNPGTTTQLFPFSSIVSARYIRLHATKLSADDFGNYYLQLGDMIVDR
ncbi:discoidin domain-containing protein [Paenibacillus sp. MBLB4367]|uniref:discoidin domain-containing protein n=1 Tax=Paenibacillus sp. MBLB4367 TaxID=3384767 RepID=UPI00390823F3